MSRPRKVTPCVSSGLVSKVPVCHRGAHTEISSAGNLERARILVCIAPSTHLRVASKSKLDKPNSVAQLDRRPSRPPSGITARSHARLSPFTLTTPLSLALAILCAMDVHPRGGTEFSPILFRTRYRHVIDAPDEFVRGVRASLSRLCGPGRDDKVLQACSTFLRALDQLPKTEDYSHLMHGLIHRGLLTAYIQFVLNAQHWINERGPRANNSVYGNFKVTYFSRALVFQYHSRRLPVIITTAR